VSTAEHSTCAIRAPGTLYCFGDNASGELGTGDNEPHAEPTLVRTPLLREIACGGTGCCALSGEGELACWGDNLEGKVGQGDPFGSQDATRPLVVEDGATFERVSVGQGHVCAIRESGALACWGRNSDGQLGLGVEPGQLREPTQVGVETDWQAISGSQHHTCGVRGDGSLWCWGRNEHSELNAPEPLTVYYEPRQVGGELDWGAVVVGWFHTCARKRDGQLWCWGRAIEGQLGVTSVDPIPDPTPVTAPGQVALFALGNFHTCAVDSAGALYCWGLNGDGQLGLGDLERRHEPVLVP
jgi:alpha-tubulin suppressor-like RCC1 family protein